MARNAQEKAKQEAEGTELYGHQSSTRHGLEVLFLRCSTNHPEWLLMVVGCLEQVEGSTL